ncbi:hypothetical protein OIU76_024538 [Salix suchowensis]|nr:hypothetical protein OIU76_024538 [Salix suchowensis]
MIYQSKIISSGIAKLLFAQTTRLQGFACSSLSRGKGRKGFPTVKCKAMRRHFIAERQQLALSKVGLGNSILNLGQGGGDDPLLKLYPFLYEAFLIRPPPFLFFAMMFFLFPSFTDKVSGENAL